MFKYIFKVIKDNRILSFILILQVIIVTGLIWMTFLLYRYRYSGYRPVKNIIENDGLLVDFFNVSIPENRSDGTGHAADSSEALQKKLRNAKVISSYDVLINYKKEPGSGSDLPADVHNIHAYDDSFISGFTPDMLSGKWISTEDKRSDMLYAAVLQDDKKYKTGDEISLDLDASGNRLDHPIKLKIIGVIDPHSNILKGGDREKYRDYRLIFDSLDYISADYLESDSGIDTIGNGFYHHNFYISKNNFDNYNTAYSAVYYKNDTDKVSVSGEKGRKEALTSMIRGIATVIFDKTASDADKQFDKNYIMQNSMYHFMRDMKDIKKSSWDYILKNVRPVFPVTLMSVVFLIFSFISANSLVYIKQKRTYDIFFINGLSRGKCRNLHTAYLSFTILCGLFISAALILIINGLNITAGFSL